ncbi:MAG: DUF2911 domain-containing protein [Crocinitomicaceae bacterium]|nr:DUF2911 domain-containing protein [Crocinitomicaceae bacterium]
MKLIVASILSLCALNVNGQVKLPKLSPAAEIHQVVGLTDVVIKYSRPAKRDRDIFPDVVPLNEIWRTGANENSTIETSDALVFGNDTLPKGTYAIFTKPSASEWEVIFYNKHDNWGTPETWNEDQVALSTKAKVSELEKNIESFTIAIENVSTVDASITFSWDDTKASVDFSVPTNELVMSGIEKVMGGPSSSDYYNAADYYLSEKKDMKLALEWINKAIELRGGEPFWMFRKKSLIQAELGDYKGAIESAKVSLDGAKKADYQSYVKMNEESIEAWRKKK